MAQAMFETPIAQKSRTAASETAEIAVPAIRGLVFAVLLSLPMWLAAWVLLRLL